jgi:hypothetical protein
MVDTLLPLYGRIEHMREIENHEEIVALCDDDTLCAWAARGPGGRSRAWASEDGRAAAMT